jgi:hypothetical protein
LDGDVRGGGVAELERLKKNNNHQNQRFVHSDATPQPLSLSSLYQQHRVHAPVQLRVVGDLGVLAPDDLAGGGDEAEVGDVDLDDGALGEDPELGVPERGGEVSAES